MSIPSSSEVLISQPPHLPVKEAAAGAQRSSSGASPSGKQPPGTETDSDDEAAVSIKEQLKSTEAIGYYISALVHVVAYSAMALVFAYFTVWAEEPNVAPIRASLDDFNRLDEQPKFEEVGEIDLGSPSSESSVQSLNNLIQESENAKDKTALQDLLPSLNAISASGVGGEADDDSFKFRVPESGFAVTKGSFTAWTVPESPKPAERYRIIIQVRLPDGVTSYRLNDLVGKVTGTDGYTQGIPFDLDKRFAVSYTNEDRKEVIIKSRSERIQVRNNKIQLVVLVPGAQRLVKDTIKLKSKRLREDHELTLVFGVPQKAGRGKRPK